MGLQDKIFKLKGKVQHYAWGGYEYIPHWLGIKNTEHKPFAEYWMGAHPSASSRLVDGDKEIILYDVIQQQPEIFIGSKALNEFGELPYLFKILDVNDMLSIQVHPSKTEAEKGFSAEEAAGIPINAPHRNYKDKNHKPEVMVALSEFWLLHGFREKESLKKILEDVPEFKNFVNLFEEDGYKALYRHVMEMPQQQVNELLTPLIKRVLQHKKNNRLTKEQPGWWVAKLYADENKMHDIDRGIFSIYFFNIVKVKPGEAVFQGAGIPHAYLEGQNVELMANSDNVLRGGLTPKHIDIPELMKHTLFEGIVPDVMKGKDAGSGEKMYNCPVTDFGISKIELHAGETYNHKANAMEIFVIIEGTMQVSGTNTLPAAKGNAMAVLYGESYTVSTDSHVLMYKAFVP